MITRVLCVVLCALLGPSVLIGCCLAIVSVVWVVARALLSDSGWLIMFSYVISRVFQISVSFQSLDIAQVPLLMYVGIHFSPFYRPPDENHRFYSLEEH